MRIYDAFLFFNEFDLLDIRLHELNDVVDVFVIVEATKTFSCKEKPLHFLNNREKFEDYSHKIRHVVIDDTPSFDIDPTRGHNRHRIEQYQRQCIDRGLNDANDDDVIIISDVDEIIRANKIPEAVSLLKSQHIVGFNHEFFYYYLNGRCMSGNSPVKWAGAACCERKFYPGAQNLRDDRGKNQPRKIDNGGWHFSYLGGPERIIEKIESFAHAEFDNQHIKDVTRISDRISQGKDLFDRPGRPTQQFCKIDESFPKYIQDNVGKFSHLIYEKK